MNLKVYLFSSVFAFLLLSGCVKEVLPEDNILAPEFGVSGVLDNNEFSMYIGPDNMVLETDFFVSASGYPVFTVDLFDYDCFSCNENLQLEIVGYELYSEDLEFTETLEIGSYEVIEYEEEIAEGNFSFEFGNADSEILQITDEDGLLVFEGAGGLDVELEDGEYNVLMVTSGDFCAQLYSFNLNLFEGQNCSALPQIYMEDGEFSYEILNDIDGDFDVLVNGVDFGISPEEVVLISDLLDEGDEFISEIVIVSTSDEGCVSVSTWYFITPAFTDCIPYLTIENTLEDIEHEPGTVRLFYADENGNEYISIEDSEDMFEITNIEPYLLDPFGREAFQIDFNADLELYNLENDDEVAFEINDASLPIVFD